MGQSNKRSEVTLDYSEAFGHCLDAVVRPRHKLAPNREGFGDQGGEACADFGSDTILDDEALPLSPYRKGQHMAIQRILPTVWIRASHFFRRLFQPMP